MVIFDGTGNDVGCVARLTRLLLFCLKVERITKLLVMFSLVGKFSDVELVGKLAWELAGCVTLRAATEKVELAFPLRVGSSKDDVVDIDILDTMGVAVTALLKGDMIVVGFKGTAVVLVMCVSRLLSAADDTEVVTYMLLARLLAVLDIIELELLESGVVSGVGVAVVHCWTVARHKTK